MKPSLLLLIILVGCATPPPKETTELDDGVAIDVALEHIGQSYTLGCVEALKERGEKGMYTACRKKRDPAPGVST